MRKLKSGILVTSMLGAAFPLQAAHAQEDAQRSQPSAAAGVEDIVVTAQKRSENLQQAPIAISAFNAETLAARQITNLSGLSAIAPSLTTTTPVGSPVGLGVFIRGIGGQEPLLTLDNAVAVYVDGIVLGRSAGAAFDVAELERIEVLRGPQGTLYGRNAVGGAVNIITKKPTQDFGVSQTLTVGNYGLLQGLSTVNTGELGSSGLRASFSYFHKQRRGVVDEISSRRSRDPGAVNTDAVRAAVAFDPGGAFRANYSFDYSHTESNQQAFQLTVVDQRLADFFAGSVAAGGQPLVVSRKRLDKIALDSRGDFLDKNWSHTLTMELDLSDDLLLRSLSGFRRWTEVKDYPDVDGSGDLRGPSVAGGIGRFNLFAAAGDVEQKQWSQELNLIGSAGKLDYILGAFYFKEKAREVNPQTFFYQMGAAGAQLNSTLAYRHESTSKALFAQATFAATDRLKLTGGVRYTWDKRTLDQTSPQQRYLSRDFRKFNWSATLDYQITDNILAFAKVSTGYKSGGFNPRSVDDGFNPETVTAYELGFKSDLFDRRLRINGSVFYNKQDNLQVQQFRAGSGGAQSLTTNAGKADFKGIELEVTAVPVEGLTLYANGSYIDRNYKQFIVLDPTTNLLVDIADRAKFNYTAAKTAAAGVEYKFPPFSFGQLSIRADYNYQSKRYFNVSELGSAHFRDIVAGGRGLLDARVALSGIQVGGGELTVALFGKNITDESYRISGIDFGSLGFAGNTYGDPMTWGFDAKIAF